MNQQNSETTHEGNRTAGRGGTVPPPEHRWQPGQSGNPKGRPRRDQTDDRNSRPRRAVGGEDDDNVTAEFSKWAWADAGVELTDDDLAALHGWLATIPHSKVKLAALMVRETRKYAIWFTTMRKTILAVQQFMQQHEGKAKAGRRTGGER